MTLDIKFLDSGGVEVTADSAAASQASMLATVWRPGFNRNGITFRAGTLRRLCATSRNRPLLFQHDPHREEGIVHSCELVRNEDRSVAAMDARITVDDPSALKSLARGVEPRFSIHPQPEQGASLTCLECGEDQLTGGCVHPWTGGALEAGGPWEMAEISRTPTPAVPGTGVRRMLTQLASAVMPSVRQQWELMMSDAKKGRPPEATTPTPDELDAMSNESPQLEVVNLSDREELIRLRERLNDLEARAAQADALETSLAAERARRIAVECRSVVTRHLRRGALRCEEQIAIELRAKNPQLFDAIVEHVPDNPAFSAGTRLTPVAGTPATPIASDDFVSLAAHADRVSRETGRDYEEVLREEREAMIQAARAQERR